MTTTTEIKARFDSSKLYDIYNVTLQTRDRLYGGVPRNEELIKSWIEARSGYDDEQTKKLVEEMKEKVKETKEAEALLSNAVDGAAEKTWNGFLCHKEKGLYLETRCLKAMFKEVGSLLNIFVKKRGSKQIVQHGTFLARSPDPTDRERIYFKKLQPDGVDEKPIHVQTAQGPRTALKRCDYVENVEVKFQIWVFKTHPAESRHISEEDLVLMLTLAQENGVGADRSQGHGMFDVVDFFKIEECGDTKIEEHGDIKKSHKKSSKKNHAETPATLA